MPNDCSERVCQFGTSHVDTPKGDLDSSSGKLNGPDDSGEHVNIVSRNSQLYPYGTTEQFPQMHNSDAEVIDNSAHYYMECSNKGYCDRSTGSCTCFDGYSGSACQRASCPTSNGAVCSGHGTCSSIRQLADEDYGNVYNLWDEDSTLGCSCDGGYEGPDCSQRLCKFGADPLYYDDYANIRYANFSYEIFTSMEIGASGAGGQISVIVGNYSLIFTDHTGEDWETGPIDIRSSCDDLTDIIEALPNNVVPANSVKCFQDTLMNIPDVATGFDWYDYCVHAGVCVGGYNRWAKTNDMTMGYMNYVPQNEQGTYNPKFTLAFSQNPGKIAQISINKFLDGMRPTLYSIEGTLDTFQHRCATFNSDSGTVTGTSGVPGALIRQSIIDLESTFNNLLDGGVLGDEIPALNEQNPTHGTMVKQGVYHSVRRLDFTTQLTNGNTSKPNSDVGSTGDGSCLKVNNRLASTLDWHIYANGFTGEDVDFVPDLCEGVTVTIDKSAIPFTLSGMSVQDVKAVKRCLGDSDNITGNNVDVYNWDYGNVVHGVPTHPHLIKLIDATQDYSYLSADASVEGKPNGKGLRQNDDDAIDKDHSLDTYPKTTLCASQENFIDFGINQFGTQPTYTDHAGTVHTNANAYDYGWCANKDPPGFFAVVYFDEAAKKFSFLHPAGLDYDLTNGAPTRFHLYTTTGMLVRISDEAAVYTGPDAEVLGSSLAAHMYSNVMFMGDETGGKKYDSDDSQNEGNANTNAEGITGGTNNWFGNFDCETNPSNTHGTRDCLSKNDYVMFFTPGDLSTAAWTMRTDGAGAFTDDDARNANQVNGKDVTLAVTNFASPFDYRTNPQYPNIYQVQKIGRMPVSLGFKGDVVTMNQNEQTQLDYSINASDPFSANYARELMRFQIVLDYGVNFNWMNPIADNRRRMTGVTHRGIDGNLAKFNGHAVYQEGNAENGDLFATNNANGQESMKQQQVKYATLTGGAIGTSRRGGWAYKFYPPAEPVEYVAQCSGRGICDASSALCGCFSGYTGDACNVQSALVK